MYKTDGSVTRTPGFEYVNGYVFSMTQCFEKRKLNCLYIGWYARTPFKNGFYLSFNRQ